MHEKPRDFPGFKVSSAAFLIDGIQNNRTPPDWWFAHEKKQEREQWERDKAEQTKSEQTHRDDYDRARSLAFQKFCCSPEGQQIYAKTFSILLALHNVTDPYCATDAARQATLTRMEREDFDFPEFAAWLLTRQEAVVEIAA
ncbi:MAG: hypothetical protein FD138_2849 [Planctomycetota bacterium]|nr:MAG: hypothetical protein FD138_2849 [Planctomycetota bacterium]